MSYHQIPNDETHAWIAARPGDARGPCPALNSTSYPIYPARSCCLSRITQPWPTTATCTFPFIHNNLLRLILTRRNRRPRDGKNLGFFQLIEKCGEVFNFSAPLAALLSTEAMLLCGNGYSVTLEQLRKHNGIEHDASLSRADAVSGNAWTPDPKVIAAFLAECSSEEGLTFDDLCRYRAKLELALPEGKLDWFHNIVARGEACLTIGVLGTGGGEDGTAVRRDIGSSFSKEMLTWIT